MKLTNFKVLEINSPPKKENNIKHAIDMIIDNVCKAKLTSLCRLDP
jgi:hypothetical protein